MGAVMENDPFLERARALVEGDAVVTADRRVSNSDRSRRRLARAARRGSIVAKRRRRQIEFERARRRARGGKTRAQMLAAVIATV
jgi:hypothetical protein